jgi:signal transduction histidine kinase
MITHPADQAMVAAHYNDSAEGNKEAEHIDFRITTKSGEKRWISHSCQPVFSEDGRWLGRRASNHDSSSRRKLMEELMKARELEAVGILSGGIAHDFNDLIAAIIGNVSIAKTQVDPDTKVYHLLTNAEEVAVRSHDLTQQLIAFSQRGKLLKKRIPISEIIKNIVSAAIDNEGIKCDFSIPENLWPVEADEGQISQAIANLVGNAKEAMGDNGLLTVSAANTTVRDKDMFLIEPGDYVRISIRDTSAGISTKNSAKIFDPYFTTKYLGIQIGTGLGLAIAYSIVANHDGMIIVDPGEGQGSTFHVYLPAEKA